MAAPTIASNRALLTIAGAVIGVVLGTWQLSGTVANSIRAPAMDAVSRLREADVALWEKVNAMDARVYKLEGQVDRLETWKAGYAGELGHLREVFELKLRLQDCHKGE